MKEKGQAWGKAPNNSQVSQRRRDPGAAGPLITLTDGAGSENYSYDILGRVTQLQKVISGTTYTTGYGYNLESGLSSITYPSGRVVQQSYDAIGRLCAIAATTSACTSYTTPYATGFGYNTAFETTGFNYGNGVTAAFGYSADRLLDQLALRARLKPCPPTNTHESRELQDVLLTGRP